MENETTPAIDTDNSENAEVGIEGSVETEISSNDVLKALNEGYGNKPDKGGKKKFSNLLQTCLKQVASKHSCSENYNILVMYDNTILVKSDSDRIYRAVTKFEKNDKPLMLILISNGGEPGSAYLIGKLCREFSNGKFIAVIPRNAKSAATLLACAAEEVHMGSFSELGPIDPQIDGMPALGLKNSIEHIAGLVDKMPDSGNMFARYLFLSVKPIQIGYYERAAQSAAQYAERLLASHKSTLTASPIDIAKKLVYDYKDHSFIIDKSEAAEIFGTNTIKSNTPEYDLSNEIYNTLSEPERVARLLGYKLYFIGSLDSEPVLIKINRE